MIELEKTYLAKYLPKDLKACSHKEIIDVYIPQDRDHPVLRLRKNGSNYELTKKTPVNENDISIQQEQTIVLDEVEFAACEKLSWKKIQKIRYNYEYQWLIAEIDIFQWDLLGLILVDFEFTSVQDKDSFIMPDFCLEEITQELFTAWGVLCGKSYEDIKNNLNKFHYQKLFL